AGPRARRPVRDPETCGDAAALRPAARARRRDEELGGDARTEPGAGREAARRSGRGPPDRIQHVRGHDPDGAIRRRHRADLGPRALGAGVRSALRAAKGPSRIHARRREAARTARDPDILEEMPKSVVSKRTLEQIANAKGAVWQSNRPVKENVRRIDSAKKSAPRAKKKTATASAKS